MEKHLLLNYQPQRGITVYANNELAEFLTVIIGICLIGLTTAAIAKILSN
jgi:hypothetical protein